MKNKIITYAGKVLKRISPVSAGALVAFVLLSLITAYAALPLDGEEELKSGIIRFHVLANSDKDYDQMLKLQVRNAVTEYTSQLLAECTDIDDAKRIIDKNSAEIVRIAEACIRDNGYCYGAELTAGLELYPRRIYGKYTFPAGKYYSVRLKIGNGAGKNWWCVLFPPMCLQGAITEKYENPSQLSDIGFSDDEIELISERASVRREVRFFFLDMISKL